MTKLSRRWATAAIISLAAVTACTRNQASAYTDSARAESAARAVQDSINRSQPGYVVDSIFPIEEEMRRFNADLAPTAALIGGGRSRGDLLRKFTRALAIRDTSALFELLISRAEFGYLVFPDSPYARAPYKTKPGIVWTQLVSDSNRGLARLLERVAGDSTRISDLQCRSEAVREGENWYWRDCTLSVQTSGLKAQRLKLFGQILERDGRAKFVSYDTAF